MKNQRKPPQAPRRPQQPVPSFDPVPVRARHDGWSAERQASFIGALAESGCVTEACRLVGKTPESAYALRRRSDAFSFRTAWDAALDYGVRRLSDAAFSRALNGVAVPVFFQGEQIGERRHYDERLTMFLLRYRDPLRYGKFNDRREFTGHPEGAAIQLIEGLRATLEDAGIAPEEAEERIALRLTALADDIKALRERESEGDVA